MRVFASFGHGFGASFARIFRSFRSDDTTEEPTIPDFFAPMIFFSSSKRVHFKYFRVQTRKLREIEKSENCHISIVARESSSRTTKLVRASKNLIFFSIFRF